MADAPPDLPDDDDDTDEGPPPTLARRAMRMARDWGLTLLLGAVIFHGVGQLRAPDLPDAAPDFALQTLEGQTVQLSSLRGQTVVLNFWATWCGPCRIEIPQFASFAEANPDIPVLGIATDGTPGELKAAAKKLGITYPVLVADAATVKAYGVDTLPTTVIVGPDGSIQGAHAGILTRPQLSLMVR
jgi:peroxiredoxin